MAGARLIAALSGRRTASFVVAHTYSPGASTSQVASLSGAQAGDLATIFVADGGNTPAGWTLVLSQTGNSITNKVFSKLLTAGDIVTGSVTLTGLNAAGTGGAQVGVVIYRRATRIVSVSTITASGLGPMVIPGYDKTAACRGVVTYAVTRTGNAPAAPVGPTSRVALGNIGLGVGDYLPASGYTSGTDVTWATAQASSSAALLELQ